MACIDQNQIASCDRICPIEGCQVLYLWGNTKKLEKENYDLQKDYNVRCKSANL